MFINFLRINLMQFRQDHTMRLFFIVCAAVSSWIPLLLLPMVFSEEVNGVSGVLQSNTMTFVLLYAFLSPVIMSIVGGKQVKSYYVHRTYINIEPVRGAIPFSLAQLMVQLIPAVAMTAIYLIFSLLIGLVEWKNSWMMLYPVSFRASVVIMFMMSLCHLIAVHFWTMLTRSRWRSLAIHLVIHFTFVAAMMIFVKHHWLANISELIYPTFIPFIEDTSQTVSFTPDDFMSIMTMWGVALKLCAVMIACPILFRRSKDNLI